MTRDGMRVPDFIVGNPKSGTTALYEMLRQHPEIFLPDVKEPMFLAKDLQLRIVPPMGSERITEFDQYLALFGAARQDQRVGEASPLYLRSRTAASAIRALNPEARIIAIFREPASFLRSFHLQLRQTHNENKRDLRRALELEPQRRVGRYIPRRSYAWNELLYSECVRYTDLVRRYHAVFSPEHMLVLIYEEFRDDNAATMREIFRFLDVDASIPIAFVQANPTVALRSQALDDAVHRFSVGRGPYSRAVKAGIKALMPRAARRRVLRVVQEHVLHAVPPPPDQELMNELRVRLKPEVERFGAYIGRDLVTTWGYDDV